LIPEEELVYIHNGIIETINEIYKYKNSVMGIMEQIVNDY